MGEEMEQADPGHLILSVFTSQLVLTNILHTYVLRQSCYNSLLTHTSVVSLFKPIHVLTIFLFFPACCEKLASMIYIPFMITDFLLLQNCNQYSLSALPFIKHLLSMWALYILFSSFVGLCSVFETY